VDAPPIVSRSLTDFRAAPDAVEAIVAATGAKEPVLDRADLERLAARAPSGSPLVVDLGVPPNVSPDAAREADVQRIGMDCITDEAASDRERSLLDLADARVVVDQALAEFRRTTADRLIGPMIAQLRHRYRRTALEGVERLFKRELAGLGEAEREAVRQWAETLARRFAHLPSVGLRDLIYEAGPGAVEAFVASAEPELARDLRTITGADPGTRLEWQ
jgi:glutamyl-tRNA reductase